MEIRRKIYWPVLAAAVIIAAIYAVASWPNQFVYDDHEVIENQFPLRNWADLATIFREPHYLNYPYYRPITRSSFAIQQAIWGDEPRAFHLVNDLLAGAALLAAFGLMRRTLPSMRRRAALLAALCFCLHPAFSECVYPAASGRESLLPAVLILLSTWAYLGEGAGNFIAAMGLWALAILCKEQAAVLPGVFLAADLLGISRGKKCEATAAAATSAESAALAAVSVGMIASTELESAESLSLAANIDKSAAQRPCGWGRWLCRYGVMAAIGVLYLLIRHAVFSGRGVVIHLAIMQDPIAPLWSLLYGVQTAIAPFWELRYEPALGVWFETGKSVVALTSLALIVVLTLRASGNVRRAGIFWLAWLVLLQLPTAHLFQQEAPFSERYVALAILAFPAMIAGIFAEQRRSAVKQQVRGIVAAWVAIGLGYVTVLRASYYLDDTAFAIQWAATNPHAAGAHIGLGFIAQQQGDGETAINQYREALQLDNDYPAAHNNLANLLADSGDIIGAQHEYNWLLLYNPRDAIAMVNDAEMLSKVGYEQKRTDYRDRAKQLLNEALAIRPGYAPGHYAMAVWQQVFGSRAAAIEELKEAIALRPDYPEAIGRLDQLSRTTRPSTPQ